VTGYVGVAPGTAITGFPGSGCPAPPASIRTTVESAVAQGELTTAYASLTQPCTAIDGNLNGVTLQPGVYCVGANANNLSATLTLNGAGRHILRFATTFITSATARVILQNGATCGNVAYQVGSSATLNGTIVGNVMVQTAATGNPGFIIQGRLLARDAAVTITTGTITNAGC
jgi:hypothetical protein